METSMNRGTLTRGLGAAVIVAALFTFGAAFAQDKKAPAKSPPSPCKGLEEAACKAKTECQWVSASVDAKGKVKRKAYCRKKAVPRTKAKAK
jgi:hypothetical protein